MSKKSDQYAIYLELCLVSLSHKKIIALHDNDREEEEKYRSLTFSACFFVCLSGREGGKGEVS